MPLLCPHTEADRQPLCQQADDAMTSSNSDHRFKTTVAGPVSATGTFNSGKNGQVTASLTVNPPPSDISCPPGQSLELASVSYTNITLTDTTNGVMISVPDVNSGCLLPNVRGAC
jgi:hypothetical protein